MEIVACLTTARGPGKILRIAVTDVERGFGASLVEVFGGILIFGGTP